MLRQRTRILLIFYKKKRGIPFWYPYLQDKQVRLKRYDCLAEKDMSLSYVFFPSLRNIKRIFSFCYDSL